MSKLLFIVLLSLVIFSSCKKDNTPRKSYFKAEIDGVSYEFEIFNSPDYPLEYYYSNKVEWILAKGEVGDILLSVHNSYDEPFTYKFDSTSWQNGVCVDPANCQENFYVFFRPANNAMNSCNTANPYSTSSNIQHLTHYHSYPEVDIYPSFFFERSDEEMIKAFFNGSLVHACSMDSLSVNFVNITNLSFEIYRDEFEY